MARVIIMVAALCIWSLAGAEEKDALQHFNAAEHLKSAGDLRGAISEYLEAARLAPDHPNALFNAAQLYRSLGQHDDLDNAVKYYCLYLRAARRVTGNEAVDADDVLNSARAVNVELGRASSPICEEEPRPKLPPEVPPEFSTRRIAGSIVLGLGLAGVASGATLLGLGYSRSDGDKSGTLDDYDNSRSTVAMERTAGLVFAVGGGVAAVAGLVTLLIPERKPAKASYWFAPATRGLVVGGSF